jgi:putative heme iron utilization protein
MGATDEISATGPHVAQDGAMPGFAPPLETIEEARLPTPSEEARTIVENDHVGSLATLTEDGSPWASIVGYGVMPNGDPVFCVSTLAEHGRNLPVDGRGSLVVARPSAIPGDPLDVGRVTLLGVCEHPADDAETAAARSAFLDALPTARFYIDFEDFSLWILRVQRTRWVGGFGRMDSTTGADYSVAEADPVAASSDYAIQHLNDDHAESLLLMAQKLGGFSDAKAAKCVRADRYGIDLELETARGHAQTRVAFAEPLDDSDGLRAGTVELAKRARG